MESSIKILTEEEIKKREFDAGVKSIKVPLTKQRQEEVKKLMFDALKDPRASYKKVSMDDIEKDWENINIG